MRPLWGRLWKRTLSEGRAKLQRRQSEGRAKLQRRQSEPTVLASAYHSVVVTAVIEGLFSFVESFAVVHLPGEAEDEHIGVVGGPVGVAIGMHSTEADGFVTVALFVERAVPREHGGEAAPAVLYIEALRHFAHGVRFGVKRPLGQEGEVGSSHKVVPIELGVGICGEVVAGVGKIRPF